MITNTGKRIVGKYLIGQAPDFATHIAAGVGAAPLYPNQTVPSYAEQEALEFEAFRVPITSRGFVKENGVEKIVIKAEMPSTYHYHISEVGFYSGDSNSLAGTYDSKHLATFSESESWNTFSSGTASAIPSITDESLIADVNNDIVITSAAALLPTDADVFYSSLRKLRNEGPRFQNKALYLSGSASFISPSFSTASAAYAVQTTRTTFNLSRNQPDDEIRLAFSVISKLNGTNDNPHRTRIVLDLYNNITGLDSESPKARVTAEYLGTDFELTGTGELSNPTSRYKVCKFPLSSFVQDDGFSWANVNMIRLYACTVDSGGNADDDYAIVFDGLRLENLTTPNPLYGLCGYDVVQTASGQPIEKEENANNYIEYRFGIGVE